MVAYIITICNNMHVLSHATQGEKRMWLNSRSYKEESLHTKDTQHQRLPWKCEVSLMSMLIHAYSSIFVPIGNQAENNKALWSKVNYIHMNACMYGESSGRTMSNSSNIAIPITLLVVLLSTFIYIGLQVGAFHAVLDHVLHTHTCTCT